MMTTPPPFDWADFKHRHRDAIIREWVRRLQTEVSAQYAGRPVEELMGTVAEAFDANYYAMVYDDYSRIDRFIDKITRIRLEGGFVVREVQNAFELFRNIVLPLLMRESDPETFFENLKKINRCLAYTIFRFSDHFQEMHERGLREYARRLEADVSAKTGELRDSELKYKTLVEEINDGYLVIQEEVVVFVNQAFCHMHGYAREEVMGKKFLAFILPEDQPKVAALVDAAGKDRTAGFPLEYRRLSLDGRSFPTEITVKSTRYADSRSVIGICRDITERVKMELQVRENERMAYVGRITASLSHEIRNPLSAVNMNLQILQKNLPLAGNDRRRMEICVKEVGRLEGILKDLLDFAKPLALRMEPCRINRILEACVDLLESRFKESDLAVRLLPDPAMPAILADENKLQQAVINLLLNAVDASPPGSEIQVESIFCPDAGEAVFSVSDWGPGAYDDLISQMFDPFVTTKSKGTGLGLTNVRRVAEAHGGRVEVFRRPAGLVFRVALPIGEHYGQDTDRR